MFSFFTSLWGYIMPIIALVLLGAAVWVYINVPVFGHQIAAVLVVIAAGTFAFDEGYRVRGNLDQSASLKQAVAQLQANNAELQRQADEAKNVADDWQKAAVAATDLANANQQKAESYVAQLPTSPGCGLTDSDVERLRAIGGPAATP